MPDTPRQFAPPLTTARFQAGSQCAKRLYLQTHSPDLADDVDVTGQMLRQEAVDVETLGQRLFPGGVVAQPDAYRFREAVRETQLAMYDPTVPAIFGAAFEVEDLRVRVDALVRVDVDTFDVVFFTSASRVKAEQEAKASLVLYTLNLAGIVPRMIRILHPNSEYVRPEQGGVDPNDFFVATDISAAADAQLPQIEIAVHQSREVVAGEEAPHIEVGAHCNKPRKCPFWGHCHRNLTEFPIHEIPRISPKLRLALDKLEIRDIREIPADFVGLTANQQRVVHAVQQGGLVMDVPALRQGLAGLRYPLHIIDFETVATAVPLFPGTSSYEAVPFQLTIRTVHQNGRMTKHDFLEFAEPGKGSPEIPLIEHLLKYAEGKGTLGVYTNYEWVQIRRLAARYPAYRERLLALQERIIDLHDVFRKSLNHRDFHGSHSLKAVLPILVPEMSYSNLAIGDGMEAQAAYLEASHPHTNEPRKAELREALLSYGGVDVEGLGWILSRVLLPALHPSSGQRPRTPTAKARRAKVEPPNAMRATETALLLSQEAISAKKPTRRLG